MARTAQNIAETLDAVNRRFYAAQSAQFHATRHFGWQGWDACLRGRSDLPARILDVGCGNGRFAAYLSQYESSENIHAYTGLDADTRLLEYASQPTYPFFTEWRRWDWSNVLDSGGIQPSDQPTYDLVVLFGVIHHVYDETRRRRLLEWSLRRVKAEGSLLVSVWDFGRHARFLKKTLPSKPILEGLDLPLDCFGVNDFFMSFGTQCTAPRYCHWISDDECGRLRRRFSHRFEFDETRIEGDYNRYWRWRRKA